MREITKSSKTIARASTGLLRFRDRAPWWGGDLQTLRNRLVAPHRSLPSRTSTLEFATSDCSGDRLVGKLEEPTGLVEGSPLILLIHGLTGCEDSTYVRQSAHFHLVRGRPVLRLNLRGAGPGRVVAGGYYHAGCAGDIQAVLNCLGGEHAARGVFAIGFSLGGNILLNLLSQLQAGHRVLGAATVSAPIEPLDACLRLMQFRNALYHRWLLQRMKRDVLSSGQLTEVERSNIKAATSVYEFDDKWVAPANGFRDAQDYYERTAGARRIASITVPTLMLHA
ncbi:MAG: YheT family hydrolase, partial [Hyphomicrobiaceae bacterium]